MPTARRSLLAAATLPVAATAIPEPRRGAAAQGTTPAFPDRPVRIVLYSAGGGTDLTARELAQRMQADLGQPVVVENRSGAATAIGAEHVARARPDGHTLFLSGGTTFSLLPLLSTRLPYRVEDSAPVSLVARFAMAAECPARSRRHGRSSWSACAPRRTASPTATRASAAPGT